MAMNCSLWPFAFCRDEKYDALVELADPESWGSEHKILRNYCDKTFQRAVQLDAPNDSFPGITSSGKHLYVREGVCVCFNTGLYTPRYEEIFALFSSNEVEGKQPWFLKGFFKESDSALGQVPVLPERVSFVDDPINLVYDSRLPIRANVDHILGDEHNYERIPEDVRNLGESTVRRLFIGAVKEAEDRAAANYMLAVPQWYNGQIQLLLPITLSGDTPDLALAIHREDGYYSARTCLSIDMAYNNARLIVRPEASWITSVRGERGQENSCPTGQ